MGDIQLKTKRQSKSKAKQPIYYRITRPCRFGACNKKVISYIQALDQNQNNAGTILINMCFRNQTVPVAVQYPVLKLSTNGLGSMYLCKENEMHCLHD